MNKWFLALLVGAGVISLGFIAYPVLLLGGAFDGCATTVYQRATSPDGQVEARVQMTDCGATTGFSRVIWVKKSDREDGGHFECKALALDGEPTVRLNWMGSILNIQHDSVAADVRSTAKTCLDRKIQTARIKK